LISILIVTESCNRGSDYQVKIWGEISGCQDKTIVLESLMPNRIDTISVEKINSKGQFEIELESIPGGILRLVIDNDNSIYLYVKDNQEVELRGQYPGLVKSYSVKGSDDSELLRQMNLRLIESSDKLNKLKDEIADAAKYPKANIDSLFQVTNETAKKLYDSDRVYLKSFIHDNSNSPVIYMALYQYIGTTPILTIDADFEDFEFVLAQLKTNNPDFPHIKLLESVVNTKKLQDQQIDRDYLNLTVGAEAPDFSVPDKNGKNENLSSYLEKKVIVGFWASWNKLSVTNLKYLADIKRNNDVEVIMISLDSRKEKWSLAIDQNNTQNFINICDFKSWESPVVKIYGVQKLPSYVFINEESVIEMLTDDIDKLQERITLEAK